MNAFPRCETYIHAEVLVTACVPQSKTLLFHIDEPQCKSLDFGRLLGQESNWDDLMNADSLI